MKHKKKVITVISLFLGIGGVIAQESTVASGGDATGSGGSASYSIGQVAYTYNTGSNGKVSEGVQQPHIMVTTGVDETTVNLNVSVYPNPVTNYLKLTIERKEFEDISYQLIGINGEVIESGSVRSNTTSIKMSELSKSTYFLKITENNKLIKTFKILK